jgi:hypothetical protein
MRHYFSKKLVLITKSNNMIQRVVLFLAILSLFEVYTDAQEVTPKPTDVDKQAPPVVTPGDGTTPPSDAIVLFNGGDLSKWEKSNGDPAQWELKDGIMTVIPGRGWIQTKQLFGDIQLHLEWRAPSEVTRDGQGRGNSGVFLMGKYEVQILDSYDNYTYPNGQAAAIYKQHVPLVNACRKPGEWQTFDIIFMAPRFNEQGRVTHAARVTVIHNGVLVQNNVEIWGESVNTGLPIYTKHSEKLPLTLQNHAKPVSFRNIWIREL